MKTAFTIITRAGLGEAADATLGETLLEPTRDSFETLFRAAWDRKPTDDPKCKSCNTSAIIDMNWRDMLVYVCVHHTTTTALKAEHDLRAFCDAAIAMGKKKFLGSTPEEVAAAARLDPSTTLPSRGLHVLERVIKGAAPAFVQGAPTSAGALHAANAPSASRCPLHAKLDYTAEEVVGELKTFMFAGHETTSNTVAWVLWELAHHPDAMARTVTEIDAVLGSKADLDNAPSRLQYEDFGPLR